MHAAPAMPQAKVSKLMLSNQVSHFLTAAVFLSFSSQQVMPLQPLAVHNELPLNKALSLLGGHMPLPLITSKMADAALPSSWL